MALVSRNDVYGRRGQVTIAPVPSRIRGVLAEVRLAPSDGLLRPCAVNLDSMVTVSINSIERYITLLTDQKIREINAAIRYALGLEE